MIPQPGVAGPRFCAVGVCLPQFSAREFPMELQVNGDAFSFDGYSVADLVHQLKLSERRIAIELNHEVLPRHDYAATQLREGDRLEIIHAIGGG